MPDNHDFMNHFLLEHAPLMRRAINKLKAQGHLHDAMEIDESGLIEHGVVGLMKAAKAWKPGADRQWHNFALKGVMDHMHQHIKDQDPVHRRLRAEAKKLAPASSQAPVQSVPKPETPEE